MVGPKVVAAVLVIDVLVLAGGVVAAARHGEPDDGTMRRNTLGRRATPEGVAEQRALERDPVLDVDVAGARLRSQSSNPAGRDLWNALQATEIRRLFDITGEPGRLVEAYRGPAEAAGWRFLEVQCSPRFRSTSMRFVKDFDGFRATLQLYGHLERPYPESGRRGLLLLLKGVTHDHNNPPVPANPESAALRRRDVHCLERMNPSDRALQLPAKVAVSGDELCALLGVGAARAVVPSVTNARADRRDVAACRYGTADQDRLAFSVLAAADPRSYYEDDQWAPAVAGGTAFLMEGVPGHPPNSAWAATRAGPVRIVDNGTTEKPAMSVEALLTLAVALSATNETRGGP